MCPINKYTMNQLKIQKKKKNPGYEAPTSNLSMAKRKKDKKIKK